MKIINEKKVTQIDKTGRIQFLINNNWKFMHGDLPEAKEKEYDDSTWYDIGIPHSFGIPYFMESEFYVGYGCYRRTLHIDSNWKDNKLYLEFQGSFQETEVYVNGMLAGVHKGGYTAFCIDITSFTTIGANQLFIRVNNLWNSRLAPRAGEHVFNGGIYRDISLIVANKVHVAWYGTFVTTPEVSDQAATILVQTEINNTTEQEVVCKLESVFLYEEEEVSRISSYKELGRESSELIKQSEVLNSPFLWHPDSPHLYKLITYLYMDNQLVDSCETEFGIRWFSFTEDKGFFLNGSHYQIHGANVHQDHAG